MFEGFKRWRANRRNVQKFYEDRREKYKNWSCRLCHDSFFEEWDNWFKFYAINVSSDNEELCKSCASGAKKERERRIELARQIVGQLMVPVSSPYRGGMIVKDTGSAWKLAIQTVNDDPFRLKYYDDFVGL